MFELVIKTDLSKMPKVVETNIDEVTPVIDAAIAKLNGLEVTDNKDEIVAADADAAKLRKMCDAIKRFRLDHIALWKEPMEQFESKCKAAEKRLTEAAQSITEKTAEVKDLWRERKREKCKAWFGEMLDANFTEQSEITSSKSVEAFFQHWVDPKTKGTWVNSSVHESAIRQAIQAEIDRMKATMEGVEANYANEQEEVKAKARLAMLDRFDMNDVIVAVNAWKKEQAEIAARAEEQRKRDAEKQAAMEQAKRDLAASREAEAKEQAAQAAREAASTPSAVPANNEPPEADAKVPAPAQPYLTETYRLEITGTREKLAELRRYGESIGITFKKIVD